MMSILLSKRAFSRQVFNFPDKSNLLGALFLVIGVQILGLNLRMAVAMGNVQFASLTALVLAQV